MIFKADGVARSARTGQILPGSAIALPGREG